MAHYFGGGFDCECPLGYRGTTCTGRRTFNKGLATLIYLPLSVLSLIEHDIIRLFRFLKWKLETTEKQKEKKKQPDSSAIDSFEMYFHVVMFEI